MELQKLFQQWVRHHLPLCTLHDSIVVKYLEFPPQKKDIVQHLVVIQGDAILRQSAGAAYVGGRGVHDPGDLLDTELGAAGRRVAAGAQHAAAFRGTRTADRRGAPVT